MPDIKPKLMADAHSIVQSHRANGGNINELIAKHANENDYSERVTESLTWMVNRHGFKAAMELDKKDEPQVADPAAVKLARRGAASADPIKVAHSRHVVPATRNAFGNGMAYTTKTASVNHAPALASHLRREKLEVESRVKVAHAELRRTLESMGAGCRLIKTLGMDKAASFEAMLSECDEAVQAVIEPVLEKSAYAAQPHTKADYALLVPRAVADFDRMKAAAAHAVDAAGRLSTLQDKLQEIRADLDAVGHEVLI